MQVTLAPSTAAEARLLAAFINDLADLMETGLPSVISAPTLPAEIARPEPEASSGKKPRSRKSATTAETPAESTSGETAAPAAADSAPGPETTQSDSSLAEAGNDPAPAATELAASSAEQAGATEESPASPDAADAAPQVVSLDDLRVMFGNLTQAGKRNAAVAVVRKYGANGLAEIPEDKRGDVRREWEAL